MHKMDSGSRPRATLLYEGQGFVSLVGPWMAAVHPSSGAPVLFVFITMIPVNIELYFLYNIERLDFRVTILL